jgi:phage terminase Nu1 subunit (DNA packaging protein)
LNIRAAGEHIENVVSAGDLMRLLDLSRPRISQLESEGVVVRLGRGRYDLDRSIRNYVRRLRTVASNNGLLSDDCEEE